MKTKDFANNSELLFFINKNDIEVISTHTTPGRIEQSNYKHSDNYQTLEVTLLYRNIKKPEKVMI